MALFIVFTSFISLIVSGIFLVKALIKGQSKKKSLVSMGISFTFMIGSIFFIPTTPQIELTKTSIETDSQGTAFIKGKTNNSSKITIDGETIETKNGVFTHKITLNEDQAKKVTVVASIGNNNETKIIQITPSKDFVAFLKEANQEQETLKTAETALALAESKPTRKNYDEAATLITSLTKERKDFTNRLAIVKEHLPIYEAVELAEIKQTREHLDAADALVATATLNKSALNQRLTTVQQKITEKEKIEQQLLAARTAVEKAEQEPTDEHYNLAVTKLKELQHDSTELTNRINVVKETLVAQKEEAKKIAEAQAQALQTPEPTPEATSQLVLVTPTGKKYHRRVCGNGNYMESTLEKAQADGLTPCSKCYN